MEEYSDNEVEDKKIEKNIQVILDRYDEDIKKIWDNVIIPYLNNYNNDNSKDKLEYHNRGILQKISINDYSIFYNFMLKNPLYEELIKKYNHDI
jgi:hypothetical protein